MQIIKSNFGDYLLKHWNKIRETCHIDSENVRWHVKERGVTKVGESSLIQAGYKLLLE